MGSALALIALAPATVLAQSPAPEPPPVPADTAPADTALPPAPPADTPPAVPAQPLAPLAVPAQPPPPPMASAPPPAPYMPAAPPSAAPAAQAVDPAATATSTNTGTAAPSDAHSAVPLTVLDRAMLESTGTASLGQALQQLSWQSNAINTQFNDGGDGSTRISLRGLAAGRTLVLVNGRRHVHGGGGTGADASVDLEAIPLALVERVEIVRGPAAAHGLGGMAGVVNVVTRQDLDGVEAAVFAGGTPGGVGQSYDASVALGQRFERGRITAAAGYHQEQAVLGADREYGRADREYDWATGEVTEFVSTAVPEGRIQTYPFEDGTGNEAWQALITQYPGANAFYNDPGAGWRPFRNTGNSDPGEGDSYNYAPENYLVTPLARYHAFAAGDYRLGDQLRAFAEASYVNRRSEQQLASEPLLTITEGVTVSADNVYNPFGRDFSDMRRRVVEAGNRRSQQDIDTMRLVVGLDGALPIDLGTPAAWRWEATYGYGATDSTQTALGNLRRDRLAAALGPSFIDAGGTPRCGTPGNPIDGCVPLDLFGGAGTITPAMLGYIGHTGVSEGRNQQHRVAFDAGGDLVRASSGAGVALTVGADYRVESGSVTPDSLETMVNPEAGFDGSYDVRGVHGSVSVIPYMDRAAGHVVELQAAASAFDLSTAGTGSTWHIAGIGRLGAGPGIRASVGRAMGAPSISELFGQGREGFPAVSDPCSDTLFSPYAGINCSADGVPGDFVDDRTQLRALQGGGNPQLRPEAAGIASIGFVFAPESVPGLALSADTFAIVVVDEVGTLGAAYILQSCYDSPPDARTNCDRIVRDPATGAIDVIVDDLVNRGRRVVGGWDVQTSYDSDTPIGRLRYRLGGTRLLRLETVGPDGVTRVGRGVHDLGVYPEYRLDGSVLWDNGVLGAGAHVRYVGSFTECQGNDCRNLGGDPASEPISREVESYLTADVLGSVTLGSALGQTMLTVGVRNLLDRQPPTVYNGFTANSDASTYDYTGRFAYLRLTQQF